MREVTFLGLIDSPVLLLKESDAEDPRGKDIDRQKTFLPMPEDGSENNWQRLLLLPFLGRLGITHFLHPSTR